MINRITIEDGRIKDLENIFEKYVTVYPNGILPIRNQLLYEDTRFDDAQIGCLHPETNLFELEGDMTRTGIPEGFQLKTSSISPTFPDFRKVIPIPNEILNAPENINPLGNNGVYQWCIENWGSVSNSSSYKIISHNTIEFETNDGTPVPKIMEGISKEFSNLIIHYEHADYNGECCGRYIYINGELRREILEDFSMEAYRLFFKLMPLMKSHYVLVNGSYQFKEDDDVPF